MRTALFAACVGLASALGGVAFAEDQVLAQLNGIVGKVLVNHGKGFVPVTDGVQLKAGDRIMVSGKGSAVLTYGPGCSLALPADSMTTYTGTESCVVGTQDAMTDKNKKPHGSPFAVLLLGAAAVGGVAIVGASGAFSSDSNSSPGPQS